MNIDDLTIGEAKELAKLFSSKNNDSSIGISSMVGKKAIIRTYSAGVHYGTVAEKSGNEIILKDARRLYYWKTNGGVSLSEVSLTGLDDESKVCASVEAIWLQPIEIIPCTDEAIKSIEEKKDYVYTR